MFFLPPFFYSLDNVPLLLVELSLMANIKSKIKRIKQSRVDALANKQTLSLIKTKLKTFRDEIDANNKEKAQALLKETSVILDKASAKNVIHKNRAAKKKAQMANELKNIGIAKKTPAKKATVKKSSQESRVKSQEGKTEEKSGQESKIKSQESEINKEEKPKEEIKKKEKPEDKPKAKKETKPTKEEKKPSA